MARPNITAIRFRPPVVIARLGNSPHPLEAFTWAEDSRPFGGGKTVIVPRKSFRVLADGSLEEYTPKVIRLRDDGAIRPVCPFLELEAEVEGEFRPLTSFVMKRAGLSLAQLSFQVTAANLKAQRRTGDEACGFEARLFVRANNYRLHKLSAWSHAHRGNLLVSPDRPIPLGAFQVIRTNSSDESLGRIRVRFTPASGEVYGPPISGRSRTLGSRQAHTIVKRKNRILNPAASWMAFDYQKPPLVGPWPGGSYDGEIDLDRDNIAWGVVDDTCDALITASLATASDSFTANARILVGPPDFAPDRRPFYSLADDLADRDPKSLGKPLGRASPKEKRAAVIDLFARIGEFASLINLERARFDAVAANTGFKNVANFPQIGEMMMTDEDQCNGKALLSQRAALETAAEGEGANHGPMLPRSEYAKLRHSELSQPAVLIPFLRTHKDRLRQILRPPYAYASELGELCEEQKPDQLRDPRFPRGADFDMRMPPFIVDCDGWALSLTRLQWELLLSFLNDSEDKGDVGP